MPLRDSDSKFLSSNCASVIIWPVFTFEDVAYVMYDTAGCISIASEYGRGVYTKLQNKIIKNNIAHRYDLAFVWYVKKISFLMLCNSNKDTIKTILRLVTRV